MKLTRRCCTFLALYLLAAVSVGAERPEQPNFMFIICDDLGWQDVGCYDVDDNAVFETPYMDALAKEGVQFWQAYSPSAVCAPSRASVLTGKHPARLGMTSVAGGRCPHPLAPHMRVIAPYTNIRLEPEEVTIPEILGPKGYYNGHVGKWHLSGRRGKPDPFDQGFDWSRQNRGIHEFGGAKGWPEKMKSPQRVPFGTNNPDDPYRLDENGFAHDQNTQDALDFMAEAVARKQPFYCYYAPYIVLAPNLTRTESLLKKYCAKMGYDYPLTGKEEFPQGQTNPHYAAMVETFDYNVHQIVSYLKETNDPRWPGHTLFENTYVFITSDNGGMEWDQENATDNYPLDRGKIHQQEGGIRVPLLVLGPDIPGNVESDVMVNGYDTMPTILSLAGEPIPDSLDGCDLARLLRTDPTDGTLVRDADGAVRDAMVWHFPHSHTLDSAFRKGRWKLFHNYDYRENPELPQYHLFELYAADGTPKDLNEAVDVSADYPELTAQLAAKHQAMLDELGAMPAYRNPNSTQKLAHQDRVPGVLRNGRTGDGVVWVEFESAKAAVVEATLLYTPNGGARNEDWFLAPARVVVPGRVEAEVPEGTTHYLFNLVDENSFLISYPNVGFRRDISVQSGFALEYSAGEASETEVGTPAKPKPPAKKTTRPITTHGAAPKIPATPSRRSVCFDFESGKLAPWKVVEGDFGHVIGNRAEFFGGGEYNKQGDYYLTTLEPSADAAWGRDTQTGVIVSPLFIPKGGEMTFRVGGGNGDDVYVALCTADGTEVRQARGINHQSMQRVKWDLTPYAGKRMFLKIVDQSTGGWGHTTADNFQFDADVLAQYPEWSRPSPSTRE